jgi:hypothetical protein
MQRVGLHITALALLVCFATHADACSWTVGYFHQVTRLKGRVVGKSLGPLQFRWLRRAFSVSGAELEIFEYQGRHWTKDNKPVARTVANSSGEFEFTDLKEGHYTLHINGGEMSDWFDVEITNKAPPTKQVTLDISPIFPDCSGGHGFEVQAEKR